MAVWALLFMLALPLASTVRERLVVAGTVHQSQSTEVDQILSEQFNMRSQNVLLLVVSGEALDDWTASKQAKTLRASIEDLDFITLTSWYSPRSMKAATKTEPGGLYLVTQVDPAVDPMTVLVELREQVKALRHSFEQELSGITLQWTGDAAVREAIVRSSNRDLRISELRALPLVFLLLLLAFRSVAAAILPLLSGGLAILFTLASASLVAQFLTLSVMVQSVASLLGLALGIDYSLLMVNRFREALKDNEDSRVAMLSTMRTAGHTVLISGSAVAIGFLGLLLVPVDQMRSIAWAGVLVALFSVLLASTLIPVVLILVGQRIEWGRIPKIGKSEPRTRWRRWAQFVCRHPGLVAVMSAVPLLLLANSSRQLSGGFPEETWLPPKTEAVQALRTLQEIDQGNIVKKLNVVLELPQDVSAFDDTGSQALRSLHRYLLKDERSQRVRSLLTVAGSNPSRRSWIGQAPETVLDHYVSPDGQVALLEFIPLSHLEQNHLSELVLELRALDVRSLTGSDGKIRVGGLPAAALDYETVIRHWFPRVILLVTLGSFLVLAFAFRSLLIPLKAVLMNLLAVFAAYGALLLVFVQGYGVQLFGLNEPITAVFPATAVIVFCAAFGISMDYEVFLISRIAEARRKASDDTHAIIEGLSLTGGLISSAAAIMVTVFGAFALGDILPTKVLGFALAAVVALDAVLVRMALGPAIIKLAGRFNWWPGSR
jgi:RND superfamily putative drug exporter